jgi:hypothetical protein
MKTLLLTIAAAVSFFYLPPHPPLAFGLPTARPAKAVPYLHPTIDASRLAFVLPPHPPGVA